MKMKQIKDFFETLGPNINMEAFGQIYAQNAYFKDPFHDLHSLNDIYDMFQNMYKKLDEALFSIDEYLDGDSFAYIKWQFTFRYKGEETRRSFTGVSRLAFNHEDKIAEHIDFWDAAEHIYETLPLLGGIMRWVKKYIL